MIKKKTFNKIAITNHIYQFFNLSGDISLCEIIWYLDIKSNQIRCLLYYTEDTGSCLMYTVLSELTMNY